jgi:pilus assembly protein Flp/PilA
MNKRLQTLHIFGKKQQGATAIEYGLLVALISLVIVVGAAAVGTNLNNLFTKISTCLATPTAAACKFP